MAAYKTNLAMATLFASNDAANLPPPRSLYRMVRRGMANRLNLIMARGWPVKR